VKTKLAALLSLCMALGAYAPAFAADDGLQQAVDGSLMVTRVGGVGAGLVLGTPVAVVRETRKTYVDMTEKFADKVGDHSFGPSVLLASVFTIPASLVLGGLKGAYYGGKNAMTSGFSNPFAPASFSLEKLED
jgi:hypothetical protein